MKATIPLKCIPKKRPRVTATHTYMEPRYVEHREVLRVLLRNAFKVRRKPLFETGDVSLTLVIRFRKKGVGDIDNLAGFFS